MACYNTNDDDDDDDYDASGACEITNEQTVGRIVVDRPPFESSRVDGPAPSFVYLFICFTGQSEKSS